MFLHDRKNLVGFFERAAKRNEYHDVIKPHIIAYATQGFAFEPERFFETVVIVTRCTAPADHRVFFLRLVQVAADERAVFVGLEIGGTDDDIVRMKTSRDLCDAFRKLVDVKLRFVGVAMREFVDLPHDIEFVRITRVFERLVFDERIGVHAYVRVDDELESTESHAFDRQVMIFERFFGRADVDHDLGLEFRQVVEAVLYFFKWQDVFIDDTRKSR